MNHTYSLVFVHAVLILILLSPPSLILLFLFLKPGFEEDILIVSEGKMAPFTHDFRKAQQRMPAIPVNIHSMNFTWQAAGQVSSDNQEGWRKGPFNIATAYGQVEIYCIVCSLVYFYNV